MNIRLQIVDLKVILKVLRMVASAFWMSLVLRWAIWFWLSQCCFYISTQALSKNGKHFPNKKYLFIFRLSIDFGSSKFVLLCQSFKSLTKFILIIIYHSSIINYEYQFRADVSGFFWEELGFSRRFLDGRENDGNFLSANLYGEKTKTWECWVF